MRITKLLIILSVVLGAISTAHVHANPYETFLDISSEDDLYDLLVAGQISDETFQVLVELLQRGIDVNKASRDQLYTLPNITYSQVDALLAYRKEVGFILNPQDLVINQILPDSELQAISAFLVVSPKENAFPLTGWSKLRTRTTVGDDMLPPLSLQTKTKFKDHVTVGLAAFAENQRLSNVQFDANRGALVAPSTQTNFRLAKGYLRWQKDDLDVVVGTFRTGYGLRLTFDKTDLISPDGHFGDEEIVYSFDLSRSCRLSSGELGESPCAGDKRYEYQTPDFKARTAMLGASISKRNLDVGGYKADLHGFVSYTPQDIYQYEIFDNANCQNPTDDTNPNCDAPPVLVKQSDPGDLAPAHSFQTLSQLFVEAIAGGHAQLSDGYSKRIGLTAYGASTNWLPNGIDLDFQEWSRRPWGGSYGAIGMDGSYGYKNTDVYFEVARSFDQMPNGGGGLGALIMAVTDLDNHEIQSSLRYYSKHFANPHSRPLSAPDEFEGLRARDELGGRVRYNGKLIERLDLRGNIDLWYSSTNKRLQTTAYLRGDYKLNKQLTLGVWLQAQDKNLRTNTRTNCFEVSNEEDDFGDTIPCGGEKVQWISRLKWSFIETAHLDLQYKHEFQDDARYDDKIRQDSTLTGLVSVKPTPKIRLKLRTQYRFDDISDNTYLRQILWTYFQANFKLRKKDLLALRYDNTIYLDDRASSQIRMPSPEHSFWLQYRLTY